MNHNADGVSTLQIGTRRIGTGYPVFIIAEVGYNFNTIEEAKASIDAAKACGVDAVKFQTFRAETVASSRIDFPPEAGGSNQFEEFQRYELSEEAHRELFDYGRKRGILVFSTPGYFDDVDLLERLEVPVYKIGSDDLTNLPFIRYVALKAKPLILSTGMGTLAEVEEALQTIQATGNEQIAILHCVSNYPVKDPRLLNLNVIPTLQHRFCVPIGFSDHTTTLTASLGAVALGAVLIERHFTLDKHLDAPDASFSADPAEMKALVSSVRELEQSLGDGIKRPVPTEEQMRQMTRKSTIARMDIQAGEIILQNQVIVKRPGTGISPALAHQVVGRRAKQALSKDEVITWEKLE